MLSRLPLSDMLRAMRTLSDGPTLRRYEQVARSCSCHHCGRQLIAQTPQLLRTMYWAHLRTCRRVG